MSINCDQCTKCGQAPGRHCEVLEAAPGPEYVDCASFTSKNDPSGSYLHLQASNEVSITATQQYPNTYPG